MNYYRYRFPPSNDHMEISEREWNHPQTMAPHETLYHMHMNNSQIYPRFPRNIRPYFPNHRREFFSFNNTRFPRMTNRFRMPRPTFDWNIQPENNPDYAVHCGTNGGSYMPPFNVQNRFNSKYIYNSSKEFPVQNAHKESFIKRNQESIGNALQRESQCSEIKDVETSHIPPNWDNNTIQLLDVGLCDQYKVVHAPELEKTKISSTVYNGIDYSSYPETEQMTNKMHPQEHMISEDPDLSETSADTQVITFNDFFKEEGSMEGTISLDPNIQNESTEENDKILEDFEKVLNSPDETSLAVYFLNNLYPPFESENALTQLLPEDKTTVPENCNLNQLEQIQVNFSEIREDLTNLDSIKSEDSPNNVDCNFLLDFNQISETENENTECKNYPEKMNQNETDLKVSNLSSNDGSEDYNKVQDSEKAICIVKDSELKHYENTERYPDSNAKIDLDGLLDKKAMEQKFIFHAPIINISQQNQISSDNPSECLEDLKQPFHCINVNDFNNKLFCYFANNIMEVLSSVKNNALAESLLLANLPEKNCDEKNSRSLTNAKILSSNPNDGTLNTTDFNLNDNIFSATNLVQDNLKSAINKIGALSFNTSNEDIQGGLRNSALKNFQISSEENFSSRKNNNHDFNTSRNECKINSIGNCTAQLSKIDPISNINNLSGKTTDKQNLTDLFNENLSCNRNDCETQITSRDVVSTGDTLLARNTNEELNNSIKTITLYPSSKTVSNIHVNPTDSISTVGNLSRQSAFKSSLNNETYPLSSNTGDKIIQSCPTDTSLFVLKSKDSDFVYSNVLDSEVLSNHMETSLSSVTNYVLDEPSDTTFNDAKGTFAMNEYNYSLISHVTQKKTLKSSRKGKKKRRKQNISTEMRLSTVDNAYLRSEVIDTSLTLPDNIFELDAAFWLDLDKVQTEKKRDCKRKRNNSTWGTRRSERIKMATITSESSHHEEVNSKNIIKSNSFQQSLKKTYCDAVTQTSTTETLGTKFVHNKDAQTQYNSSDICLQNAIEKFSPKSEISKMKYHLRSFTTFNKNVVRDNKRNGLRSKSEEISREYRITRSTIRAKKTNINSVVDVISSTFNPNSGITKHRKPSQCNQFTTEANISKTISKSNQKFLLSSKSKASLNNSELSCQEKIEVSETCNSRTATGNKPENQFIPKGTYKNISKHELTKKSFYAIRNGELKYNKRKASYSMRQKNVSCISPQAKKIKPNLNTDRTICLRSSKRKM